MPMWPTDIVDWVRVFTFVPILVCSIIGFGLTLSKWRTTRPSDLASRVRLVEVLALVNKRDYAKAIEVGASGPSWAIRLVTAVVQRAGASRAALKDRAELVGRQTVRELEYGLGGLAIIATLGPLFGLLGTVIGIVIVFNQLTATAGLATPEQLAGGIGTALHTTVAGLVVGVLALVSHRMIAARADRIAAELEETALEVIDGVCGSE